MVTNWWDMLQITLLFMNTCRLNKSGCEVIKLVSCSTQLSMKVLLLVNLKFLTIANSFLPNISEHENFSGNKYEKCQLLFAFSYLLAEKISCSAELSMKNLITSGPGLLLLLSFLCFLFLSKDPFSYKKNLCTYSNNNMPKYFVKLS